MTTRSIPPSLARVLEELELRQPGIVTKSMIEEILAEVGSQANVRTVLDELQRLRWLLPLKTAGAWEFAPAARAGAFGAGDPFIELRATLARRPELPVLVAEESAAWLQGLLDRRPTRDVISAPAGLVLPKALSEYRVVRLTSDLEPARIDGLPVWSVEMLLVLMAARPGSFKPWATVHEWLNDAFERVDTNVLIGGLREQDEPTCARLGHMALVSGNVSASASIERNCPLGGKGPFFLGPRNWPGAWDSEWRVRDSVLAPRRDAT